MPIYNVLRKDDIFITIDLLGSSAFEEFEGFKNEGFEVCGENIEACSSDEAIKSYKLNNGLAHEFVDSVYVSTCSILPKNTELVEVLGVVTASDKTGLGATRQLAEMALNKIDMRFNASLRDIESMKLGVIDCMRLQSLNMGGNAVIDISIEVMEISGSGTSLFLVSGTGTACRLNHE